MKQKRLIFLLIIIFIGIAFFPIQKCLADSDSVNYGAYIVFTAIGIIVVGTIIYFIVKRKKRKQEEDVFSFEDLPTQPLETTTIEAKPIVQKMGCAHSERPIQHQCINCGAGMCYECALRDRLASVITGTASMVGTTMSGDMVTAGGFSTKEKYGIFCARCYLERVSKPDYKIKLTGDRKIYPKKPNFFTLGNIGFIGKFVTIFGFLVVGVFTLGIGIFVFWIPLYSERNNAYKEYRDNKQKAVNIVQMMQPAK